MPPREAMPKAKAAALKALELDPTLGEAHASPAMVLTFYDWDFPAGEKEFKRAIELNPGYASAHGEYAAYLTAMGRFDLFHDLRAKIGHNAVRDAGNSWHPVQMTMHPLLLPSLPALR